MKPAVLGPAEHSDLCVGPRFSCGGLLGARWAASKSQEVSKPHPGVWGAQAGNPTAVSQFIYLPQPQLLLL